MVTCYIGIGSNIGDRSKFIENAIGELKRTKEINYKRSSSIYETEPVSDIPQGKFLNGVLEIETGLAPKALFEALNKIEKKLGRVRNLKNAPRTVDLDILYYGDETINEKELMVPHPKISEREFVLRGLRELGKA
ncbi:MAG: 2-amino-4-hydroxy-6-hydroxymethyldihydropteridine diphosphokinase [Candidatus Omnitrophica bacterium]|nr:2-amino-4-hydroxy-6-hydroxymethyldihydropteridine diphosphokinase [Candidatus Omnitrophota bacterium]